MPLTRLASLGTLSPFHGEREKRRDLSAFLRRNQLLRKFAALVREGSESCKQHAIGSNQVQARQYDRNQSRRQKEIHLALHAIIDRFDLLRRLFLALIVLHEKTSDCCTEGGLPGLQRQPNLVSRIGVFSCARQVEHVVDPVPELGDGCAQVLLLFRCSMRY